MFVQNISTFVVSLLHSISLTAKLLISFFPPSDLTESSTFVSLGYTFSSYPSSFFESTFTFAISTSYCFSEACSVSVFPSTMSFSCYFIISCTALTSPAFGSIHMKASGIRAQTAWTVNSYVTPSIFSLST